jgi:hypothetical protein
VSPISKDAKSKSFHPDLSSLLSPNQGIGGLVALKKKGRRKNGHAQSGKENGTHHKRAGQVYQGAH